MQKQRQRQVTMKDLARELGVSVATVSRALKGSNEIGEPLRQRVCKLASERDYHPNPFAQSLRKGAPKLIGVIVPNIVTHFNSGVIAGIEDRARQEGYSVICANSHEQWKDEVVDVDNLVSFHVDGIIACLAQDTTDYSHFQTLHKINKPVVFFARTCLPEFFSSVVSDGVAGAYQATEHLLSVGCRRIAFIGGPNHLDMVKRRKHGYLEALHDARLPIDRSLVCCAPISFDNAYQSMCALLDLPERPDGVIAVNHTLIYGAMKAIKDHSLQMPADIRLAGFSDAQEVQYLSPPITTIEDQAHLMGERACQLLLDSIRGSSVISHEVIPMHVIIRQSSESK